jgi:hypothetical protein
MRRIGVANQYSYSRPNGLTATERRLIQQAKDALDNALSKTNTFFNEDWKPYRTAVEGLDLSPFKEIKTFQAN